MLCIILIPMHYKGLGPEELVTAACICTMSWEKACDISLPVALANSYGTLTGSASSS